MRDVLAFLPYVFRTVRRARMRTVLTILGAALALGLFAFMRTVDRGVADLAERSSQEVLVVFEESRFCPLTSEMPVRYAGTIRDVPGVKEVLPTLVFINSCRANLDLVTLHGVDATRVEDIYDFELLAGGLADWRNRSDGAIVGERLANRRGLQVGERAQLGEVDVHVSGIMRGRGQAIDNLAFVHLDQLSLARDKLGAATQFLVAIDPGASAEQIARTIDKKFATDESRTDTKTMQAFVAGAVSEITEVVEFGRILGYIAVAIVALILANTVFISAQARAQEMGVLETIGLTKSRLAGLVTLEGVALGLLGGMLGAAIVLVYFTFYPTTLGVEGHGIDFKPDLRVAAETMIAALLLGLLASLPPAISAVRRPLALAVKAE